MNVTILMTMPPQATLMDNYHEEHYLIDNPEELKTDGIIILSDDDSKKLKVDGLKNELCCCGLSHAGKKAELEERQEKAMIDKVPTLNSHQISVAHEKFNIIALPLIANKRKKQSTTKQGKSHMINCPLRH